MGVEAVSSDAANRVNSDRQAKRADERKTEDRQEDDSKAQKARDEAVKADKGSSISAVA